MSTTAQPVQPSQPLVKSEPRETRIVQDNSALAYLFDTARFEHMYRIARAMGNSSFLPVHMKGKTVEETVGNCFRLVNQAIRWGMDPFAMVDETYVVHGRLGYQGKLVAAVINSRAGLANGLRCVYSTKSGDELAVVIYGSTAAVPDNAFEHLAKYAESEDRKALTALTKMGVLAIRLSVAQGKTGNDMWIKDPEQKLFYSGATKWARRHRPEIMLGVLSEDDEQAMGPAGVVIEQPPVGNINLRNGNSAGSASVVPPAGSVDMPAPAANTPPVSAASPESPAGAELEVSDLDLSRTEARAEYEARIREAGTELDVQAIRDEIGRADNDWLGAELRQLLLDFCLQRSQEINPRKPSARAAARSGRSF